MLPSTLQTPRQTAAHHLQRSFDEKLFMSLTLDTQKHGRQISEPLAESCPAHELAHSLLLAAGADACFCSSPVCSEPICSRYSARLISRPASR